MDVYSGDPSGCALPSCHLASELGNPCATGSQLPNRHLAASVCLELSEGWPCSSRRTFRGSGVSQSQSYRRCLSFVESVQTGGNRQKRASKAWGRVMKYWWCSLRISGNRCQCPKQEKQVLCDLETHVSTQGNCGTHWHLGTCLFYFSSFIMWKSLFIT